MKTATTKQKARKGIADDTPMLPHVIARCVCDELFKLTKTEYRHLSWWLAARAERIYQKNERFAKSLRRNGNYGRDYLYMFMRHWAAAFVLERFAIRVEQAWALGEPYADWMKAPVSAVGQVRPLNSEGQPVRVESKSFAL